MTGFYSCHKTNKNFKSFHFSWGRCLKIRDVFMDFEPYFNVHNLVSVHPKMHHTLSNDQSQHDLSCDGISLSIG